MNGKVRKNRAGAAVFAAVCVFLLFLPFLAVFLTGTLLPAQYGETWYGELSAMCEKAEKAEGKKILIVGNSSVAFGTDTALMEELLAAGGLDYTVCGIGLYGSLGTKMMLEICENYVEEDDIVIFAPETEEQPMSLYFSASEAWLAVDSDLSMFTLFSGDTQGSLAGNFFGYTADKLSLWTSGETAQGSGVYAKSSFDGNCDLKNYDRPYNTLPDGVDSNNPIVLSEDLLDDDFTDYVNEFYETVLSRGASMYYSYAPMNEAAVDEESSVSADGFDAAVSAAFDFPRISKAEDYILEKEYFYDSNYHLNESGMTVRTVQLVNDIKNALGNTTKTEYTLPEKPVIPDTEIEGEGDNSDAAYFTYTQDGNYYVVSGLTEEGSARTDLTVPYQVDGLYVKSFTADVFAGNTVVESVTIQENITSVSDGSFSGCTGLKTITFLQEDPTATSVGYGLLTGTDAVICVPDSAVSAYKNNYFWGHYADSIVGISE